MVATPLDDFGVITEALMGNVDDVVYVELQLNLAPRYYWGAVLAKVTGADIISIEESYDTWNTGMGLWWMSFSADPARGGAGKLYYYDHIHSPDNDTYQSEGSSWSAAWEAEGELYGSAQGPSGSIVSGTAVSEARFFFSGSAGAYVPPRSGIRLGLRLKDAEKVTVQISRHEQFDFSWLNFDYVQPEQEIAVVPREENYQSVHKEGQNVWMQASGPVTAAVGSDVTIKAYGELMYNINEYSASAERVDTQGGSTVLTDTGVTAGNQFGPIAYTYNITHASHEVINFIMRSLGASPHLPAELYMTYGVKLSDATPPAITINSPQDGKKYGLVESTSIDVMIIDNQSGVAASKITLNGKEVNQGYNIEIASLLAITNTLTVWAIDNAGNEATKSSTFYVDCSVASIRALILKGMADGSIRWWLGYSFLFRLAWIERAIENGNISAAVNMINDFIRTLMNQVDRRVELEIGSHIIFGLAQLSYLINPLPPPAPCSWTVDDGKNYVSETERTTTFEIGSERGIPCGWPPPGIPVAYETGNHRVFFPSHPGTRNITLPVRDNRAGININVGSGCFPPWIAVLKIWQLNDILSQRRPKAEEVEKLWKGTGGELGIIDLEKEIIETEEKSWGDIAEVMSQFEAGNLSEDKCKEEKETIRQNAKDEVESLREQIKDKQNLLKVLFAEIAQYDEALTKTISSGCYASDYNTTMIVSLHSVTPRAGLIPSEGKATFRGYFDVIPDEITFGTEEITVSDIELIDKFTAKATVTIGDTDADITGWKDVKVTIEKANPTKPAADKLFAVCKLELKFIVNGNEENDAYIGLNNDDNNNNNVNDMGESGFTDASLVELVIKPIPSIVGREVKLNINNSGSDKIKVWTSQQKGREVLLPEQFLSGDLGKSLWVEGIKGSDFEKDIRFLLEYDEFFPTGGMLGENKTSEPIEGTVIGLEIDFANTPRDDDDYVMQGVTQNVKVKLVGPATSVGNITALAIDPSDDARITAPNQLPQPISVANPLNVIVFGEKMSVGIDKTFLKVTGKIGSLEFKPIENFTVIAAPFVNIDAWKLQYATDGNDIFKEYQDNNYEAPRNRLDEEKELNPGAIVGFNADDDNKNYKMDKDEENIAINHENDLVKLTLYAEVAQQVPNPSIQLMLQQKPINGVKGGRIRIWRTRQKDTQGPVIDENNLVANFTTQNLPAELWVEGTRLSGEPRDLSLTLSIFSGGGLVRSDAINLTVVGVEVHAEADINSLTTNYIRLFDNKDAPNGETDIDKMTEGKVHARVYLASNGSDVDIETFSFTPGAAGKTITFKEEVPTKNNYMDANELEPILINGTELEYINDPLSGMFAVTENIQFQDSSSNEPAGGVPAVVGGRLVFTYWEDLPRHDFGIRPPGWLVNVVKVDLDLQNLPEINEEISGAFVLESGAITGTIVISSIIAGNWRLTFPNNVTISRTDTSAFINSGDLHPIVANQAISIPIEVEGTTVSFQNRIKLEFIPQYNPVPITDTVLATVYNIEYIEQTTRTTPLNRLNSIRNPAYIVNDSSGEAIFRIKSISPAIFDGVNNDRLKWRIKSGSTGDVRFYNNIGTEISCRGTKLGDIQFALEIDGYEIITPEFKSRVVNERTVTVRVNIINTPGLVTFVSTKSEVDGMIERMNIYWRQLGIRFELENSRTIRNMPSGVVATAIGNGVFKVNVPITAFDGTILSALTNQEITELQIVNNINRSASANVVNIYSVANVGGAGVAGLTFPGLATNPANTPSELAFTTTELTTGDILFARPCMFVDGDTAGNIPVLDVIKNTWAHEIGHYFRLRHPDDIGNVSPLIINDGRNLMTGRGQTYPVAEDLIGEQGSIAIKSQFVRDR
ncbi:MAG: hypothetical protein HY811_09805 [Planctomycetes bacterium]|nr:hypothetical protein [Planctomycetota bacterium]